MKNKLILAILFVLTGVLTGCDKDTDYLVTIHTEYGDIKAILFDDTPIHKENFIKLASEGHYDSTTWHRVIEEFMIQGGDINQKSGQQERFDHLLPAEFVPKHFHRKGAIAAARQPDNVNPELKSSGTQFYIVDGKVWNETELLTDMNKLNNALAVLIRIPEYDSIGKELIRAYQEQRFDDYNKMCLDLVPAVNTRLGQDVSRKMPLERVKVYTTEGGSPWLDDQYTVFGQVVEGMDVIDRIAAVEVGRNDKPVRNTYMTVEIEEVPKKKLTEKYGIIYPETDK